MIPRARPRDALQTAPGTKDGDDGTPAARGPDAIAVPGFDWSQFDDPARFNAEQVRQPPGLSALRDAITQSEAFPDLQGVFVVTSQGVQAAPGSAVVFADGVPLGNAAGRPVYYYGGNLGNRSNAFLEDVCVFPPTGLYRVLSQISPHGGGDFADMPLLDRSDPRHWMLVVAARRGDDLVIYRKLYASRVE